ncbi:MAG: DUF262 domain-containing protein [Bacteroidia bacterium]|nr:DUF262 domain-containing protein [Bacteroidia bacterium]
MTAQRYTVTQYGISTLLTWVQTGAIAIPEIQRPFVWSSTKVRNFLDSLYQGFPVGYLIAWKNHDVKLKDGSFSDGKRILIDGQQRVTALMAALLGWEVMTKDYEHVRIRIAFHPQREVFEVHNPAIAKDVTWIQDVSVLFANGADLFSVVMGYCAQNPGMEQKDVFQVLSRLAGIVNNQVGVIDLDAALDIETVTEIFIRVNSEGVPLSQADFAMSKIASNEEYGGSDLRKAIDYFCHLAVAPDFYKKIQEGDKKFADTDYFGKMSWLQNENDDIYDPSYTDMLRVAFTSEFRRGKLEDLVALLSGRNFETKQYEADIAEKSFALLRKGVMNFMNENKFKQFVMIVTSAGFVDSALLGSQNVLNFGYILYLSLRDSGAEQNQIQKFVRRWLVMSMLTGRYSGSAETRIDNDIKQIQELGFERYAQLTYDGELSDAYWDTMLPQQLVTISTASPAFNVFRAAQVYMLDKGFLSDAVTVHSLLTVKSDLHHFFPKDFLKKNGATKGRYNQVANLVVTDTPINLCIGSTPPEVYMAAEWEACLQPDAKKKRCGHIELPEQLMQNLNSHCIPLDSELYSYERYDDFLEERRKLMAGKMREYFKAL